MWFFRVLLGLFLLVINLFNKRNVRFEVLWKDVTSCSLVDILYMLFPLFCIPRNWKQQISIKHWYLSAILHGVTFLPHFAMNNSSACNIDGMFLWFYHVSAVSQNFIYMVLWYAVSFLTNTNGKECSLRAIDVVKKFPPCETWKSMCMKMAVAVATAIEAWTEFSLFYRSTLLKVHCTN